MRLIEKKEKFLQVSNAKSCILLSHRYLESGNAQPKVNVTDSTIQNLGAVTNTLSVSVDKDNAEQN